MGGTYPTNWAGKNERVNNCAAFEGRYKNIGEGGERRDYNPSLSQIFQFPYHDWDAATEVQISLNIDATVKASIWDKDGNQIFSISKLKFKCSGGKLLWQGSPSDWSEGHGHDDPLAGVENLKMEITKGKDGALYYLNEESGGGLVYMFLPIVYSGSYWVRFDSVKMSHVEH